METQKIKTAVVVLNWNGKAWLEKFLPNLVNHSQVATVFVADNASTDDSVDYVKINYNFTWNAPSEVVHQLGYDYPVLGGLNDGWKTRKAGRYRAEASAG